MSSWPIARQPGVERRGHPDDGDRGGTPPATRRRSARTARSGTRRRSPSSPRGSAPRRASGPPWRRAATCAAAAARTCPHAPASSSSAMTVAVPVAKAAGAATRTRRRSPASGTGSRCRTIPIRNAASPIRVTMNAFFAAAAAAGRSNQNPISRYEQRPTPSHPTYRTRKFCGQDQDQHEEHEQAHVREVPRVPRVAVHVRRSSRRRSARPRPSRSAPSPSTAGRRGAATSTMKPPGRDPMVQPLDQSGARPPACRAACVSWTSARTNDARTTEATASQPADRPGQRRPVSSSTTPAASGSSRHQPRARPTPSPPQQAARRPR